jgi:hypothetical protein
MSISIKSLNNTKNFKLYWIFIYSYKNELTKTSLPIDKILLFPLSLYTPFKNRALPTLIVSESLDLESDNDLEFVLNKFNLKNVNSISEMVITENTNILAIEVDDTKKIKGYEKHLDIFFYTCNASPEKYISVDNETNIKHVPKNKHLLRKLKINIGSNLIVNTNVTLYNVFKFIFKDYFNSLLSKTKTIVEMSSFLEQRIKDRKAEDIDADEDADGYDTDDSQLSYYSYNLKHNIKDI